MFLSVERDKDENFHLVMSPPLFHYFKLLPLRLRNALEDPDYTTRTMQRLFPPGYADPEKEAEYRGFVRDDLMQQRLAKIQAFEELLTDGTVEQAEAKLTIPADRFDACLSFLNDLRVLLGEELEIEDEDWDREYDPADPRSDKVLMLHLLGFVEQGLLEATGMVDLDIDPDDL